MSEKSVWNWDSSDFEGAHGNLQKLVDVFKSFGEKELGQNWTQWYQVTNLLETALEISTRAVGNKEMSTEDILDIARKVADAMGPFGLKVQLKKIDDQPLLASGNERHISPQTQSPYRINWNEFTRIFEKFHEIYAVASSHTRNDAISTAADEVELIFRSIIAMSRSFAKGINTLNYNETEYVSGKLGAVLRNYGISLVRE